MTKKAKGRYYQDVAFRSEKDDWETPYWVFEVLDQHFDFECDVAADDINSLCFNYFTRENSCLDQEWYCMNYMNPPYGRGMDVFIKKAYEEYEKGAIVVCLIPARTDTRYWHDYIFPHATIRFLKGRVKFENGNKPQSAPFPSAVVIFGDEW